MVLPVHRVREIRGPLHYHVGGKKAYSLHMLCQLDTFPDNPLVEIVVVEFRPSMDIIVQQLQAGTGKKWGFIGEEGETQSVRRDCICLFVLCSVMMFI